jgi:hypothetical protein
MTFDGFLFYELGINFGWLKRKQSLNLGMSGIQFTGVAIVGCLFQSNKSSAIHAISCDFKISFNRWILCKILLLQNIINY